MLQEQPKEKDAPQEFSLIPWQAQDLLQEVKSNGENRK